MKSLQKMIAGLALGMALCTGLLATSPAAAQAFKCLNTNNTVCCTFTCAASIVVNGATYVLAAVSCTCTTATSCSFTCIYRPPL